MKKQIFTVFLSVVKMVKADSAEEAMKKAEISVIKALRPIKARVREVEVHEGQM
jgi:hypothetical protein